MVGAEINNAEALGGWGVGRGALGGGGGRVRLAGKAYMYPM